jgi:drug/metabolite transporter (DMT)-like permease
MDGTPASAARRFGFVMLIGVALAWGCNWPAMKIVVREVPVWQFRAVTGLAAAALLFLIVRLAGQGMAVPRRHWAPLALASLLNVTSWFVLIGYGVKLLASGHAAILAFTMPVFAAVLGALFFGEKLTPRRVASLALGTAGVVVLLSHDFAALGGSALGVALTLWAALNWAVGVQVQKRVAWTLTPLAQAAWQMLLGVLPICIVAVVLEPFVYHRASSGALAASVYVAVISLAFAYYAWFTVVAVFPASVAAIGSLLVPIVGVVSAALWIGEPLGWRESVALVLVVGAVALVMIQPQAPKSAQPKPTAP